MLVFLSLLVYKQGYIFFKRKKKKNYSPVCHAILSHCFVEFTRIHKNSQEFTRIRVVVGWKPFLTFRLKFVTRANHCCSSWGGCQIPWGSIVKVVSSELTIGWCRRPTNYIGLDLQLFYCIGFVCQYTLYLTLRRKNIVLLTILQRTSFSCKINNKKTKKIRTFWERLSNYSYWISSKQFLESHNY